MSPKFYGLPKVHKPGNPLRPIVSSTGTATYNTAKELARILKPLVGSSIHHVQNTRDFVEQIKETRLKTGRMHHLLWCCCTFYICAYSTCSQHHQRKISQWHSITPENLHDHWPHHYPVGILFEKHQLCVPGAVLPTMEGAAMGSPLSPIMANIFMESFEQQALDTAPHPPSLWKRYVDDTFVIQEEQHQEEFHQHINSIDPNIRFTAETIRADGLCPS